MSMGERKTAASVIGTEANHFSGIRESLVYSLASCTRSGAFSDPKKQLFRIRIPQTKEILEKRSDYVTGRLVVNLSLMQTYGVKLDFCLVKEKWHTLMLTSYITYCDDSLQTVSQPSIDVCYSDFKEADVTNKSSYKEYGIHEDAKRTFSHHGQIWTQEGPKMNSERHLLTDQKLVEIIMQTLLPA